MSGFAGSRNSNPFDGGSGMSLKTRVLGLAFGWVGLISGLHAYLNVNWATILNDYLPAEKRKFNVAFIPVTCHLACPVTDYISKFSKAGEIFLPRMFQGFPEIKEALISNKMQAAFIVAPLAIALRSQGVPIKIVYLGHRYGSAVVVRKDGPVKTFADLRGRIVAIPSRFSDERLIIFRALAANGMGEPFPSQAESAGFGRVLFHARQYWPDYISCVLVVRQDVIDKRPEAVQVLVDGVARSGLWLEEKKRIREHRLHAADFVGRYYYRQDPRLLRWALTKPIDRVMYEPLSPHRSDFDLIVKLMHETGVLEREIAFEDFVDTRFAEGVRNPTPWKYEAGYTHAE